ncbi:MAG: amidohydrolase [Candidatus Dactylopiibacterium carminicum]|uniref:Amidohydrolase n=1 Tax=Candidatus Dactylopiibacterium carminicum TaxID=857335 RepID=A0A272EWM3_9RHOO|nr:M20 aminoacylase family protein [Candidatus Dactylopiibacterium carminicum]KAF7599929.1 amidohydrolase [Candidatus Dactylopiibacterium carminicum]PAS94491.1 MAG: amidohydrolase [Candidatus Dactylopiibacterium carminicum]PAS97025.1 MAG: amidohydrolase [Candidatus Dactylopiibacterium carminicum]PAS99930.1 MAG: amidohydrolase [Candidatus Dactylopiibacterium carminicum]
MTQPQLIPGILEHREESIAMRHYLHARPELAFEEHGTSAWVAEKLRSYGYEVHCGLGGTGVVGQLKRGDGARRLGLRADMDALPVLEETGLSYASTHTGKMHACGHDGHTASLLAAARYFAEHGRFNGTLNLIFQPAEEGLGGARKMIEDGLFELFPCDGVFAFHNWPGFPVGKFGVLPGTFMSSSDTVFITVNGRGGHGAMPHNCVDAAVVAAHIVVALQSIVARNVDPREMAVITVGNLKAGTISNVIAETAQLDLSVRAYSPEVRALLRDRITELAGAQARALGATVSIDYRWRYPALKNSHEMTRFAYETIRDCFGADALIPDMRPLTGSEDFSFMLEACPGCYVIIGNGEGEGHCGCSLHSARYDFNDQILPVAASYWVHLTERFLA